MLGLINGIKITMRAMEALLAPWLSLLIRLWLTQDFIIVGVHQMMDHAASTATEIGSRAASSCKSR
jgi:hypothetical protein